MSDFQIAPDVLRLISHELALGGYIDEQDVLRQALVALAEQRDTVAGIERGLADAAAGRVVSRDDFERDFRARHGISHTK